MLHVNLWGLRGLTNSIPCKQKGRDFHRGPSPEGNPAPNQTREGKDQDMSTLANNTSPRKRDNDLLRYEEIARQADLGVNLWSSLMLAAERGDDATITLNCKQIQILTRETFALVKLLGEEDVTNG